MSLAGQAAVEVSARDVNVVLARVRPGLHYSKGGFHIEQELPMGIVATCVAVPYQYEDELHVAVPFDKISSSGLGMFAGKIAKTFWGTVSGQIQHVVDRVLLQHGLPADTVVVTQATFAEGRKGGLIRVSLPHLNSWLRAKSAGQSLSFRIATISFTPAAVRLGLEARLPL